MNSVWIVVGWFGDQEWIEGVYRDESSADTEVTRLWETRASDKGPEYSKGLHKFGCEEYPLR